MGLSWVCLVVNCQRKKHFGRWLLLCDWYACKPPSIINCRAHKLLTGHHSFQQKGVYNIFWYIQLIDIIAYRNSKQFAVWRYVLSAVMLGSHVKLAQLFLHAGHGSGSLSCRLLHAANCYNRERSLLRVKAVKAPPKKCSWESWGS